MTSQFFSEQDLLTANESFWMEKIKHQGNIFFQFQLQLNRVIQNVQRCQGRPESSVFIFFHPFLSGLRGAILVMGVS